MAQAAHSVACTHDEAKVAVKELVESIEVGYAISMYVCMCVYVCACVCMCVCERECMC